MKSSACPTEIKESKKDENIRFLYLVYVVEKLGHSGESNQVPCFLGANIYQFRVLEIRFKRSLQVH